MNDYLPRRRKLAERLRVMPAVVVTGARQTGKRTLAAERLPGRPGASSMVFLMRNVAESPDITWAQEMISYGAQVLTRESMPDVLEDPEFYGQRG